MRQPLYLYSNLAFLLVSTDDTSVITSHKKLRPKPVVIAEHPPEHNVPTTATGSSKADKAASTLDGNKDHLETKKQIEMLRSQHGDSWLQNHGANMGQLSPQLTTTSSNRRDEASIVDENMDSLSFGQSDTTLRASTPLYLGLDGTTIKVRKFFNTHKIIFTLNFLNIFSPTPVPTKRPTTMTIYQPALYTNQQMNQVRQSLTTITIWNTYSHNLPLMSPNHCPMPKIMKSHTL